MSRVLPVLFNTEMVRATLEGRRSCISLKIPIDIVNNCDVETDGTLLSYENNYGDFIKPVNCVNISREISCMSGKRGKGTEWILLLRRLAKK